MDQLIIMQIPGDLPTERHVSPKGELIVYKEGAQHYKVNYPVSINMAGPNIYNIIASPEYGDWKTKVCAVSGGILTLQGKNLGSEPGSAYSDLN